MYCGTVQYSNHIYRAELTYVSGLESGVDYKSCMNIKSTMTPEYSSDFLNGKKESDLVYNNATLTTVDNSATTKNLSDRWVTFKVKMLDLAGNLYDQPITVKFYTYIQNPTSKPVEMEAVSHKLDASNKTMLKSLGEFFESLKSKDNDNDNDKTALWQKWAVNVKAEVLDENGMPVNGIKAELVDKDEKVTTDNKAMKSIQLTFDETQCPAGKFTLKFSYDDSRSYDDAIGAEAQLTITNPALPAFTHIPALFDGNKLEVYGLDYNSASAALTYALSKAYAKMPTSGYWFKFDPTKNKDLTSPLDGDETVKINSTTIGHAYSLDLYYRPYGNASVTLFVETIVVTPRSTVQDGSIKALKALSIKHGVTGNSVNISTGYSVLDYYTKDLKAFAADRNDRIAAVSVKVADNDPNAKLINITSNGNDFNIATTDNAAVMVAAKADVALKISVTDRFGKVKSYDAVITVNK
ncbi:MAG: hypothetical protein PHV49_06675 [Alistipes sp.]|nr:hypothetical protein [Alistipes sp.]